MRRGAQHQMPHLVGSPRCGSLCLRDAWVSAAIVDRHAQALMGSGDTWRPRLAARVRLKFDSVAQQQMLLFPEAALLLNETGAAIVRLCDGVRSIDQIVDGLAEQFRGVDRERLRFEAETFLESIRTRGVLQ